MKIKLILDKQTDYVIALPEDPTPVEQTAAEELRGYLKKALGVELAIKKESEICDKAFYIGHTDYAKKAGVLGKTKENWILKMNNGNMILTGGLSRGERGVIYAVYHFIEDVLGVRWWNRFEEDVPVLSELSVEEDFYKEGTPAFYYRKILSHKEIPDYFYEAKVRDNIVMEDDGIPDYIYNESIARLGGAMHMGRPSHVHSLGYYFPAWKYFDKHPDWFAWSDFENRRISYGHYCLTNEEYTQAMIDKLMGYIEEDQAIAKEKGVEPPVFYSVSFPDAVNGFCQCEKCKQIVEKSGPSGYAINFVNKLARAVGEKYPDVRIETLVYSLYLDKPLDDTLPEKNVIIRLAQVFVDIIHGVRDKGNSWYLQLLKDWSAICKKAGCDLYIWEYMYNLFLDIPAPVANRLGDTFRSFYEYGVKGVFVENQCSTSDMWELNQYLLTHLAEDPYADTELLIEDFMNRFYGPAAPYVKEYYKELVRAATENNFSVFCVIESAHFNYLDVQAVTKGITMLEKAMDAVWNDPIFEPRVRYVQTLLVASAVIKFYDLKKQAKALGVPFDLDRQILCNMAILGYQEADKRQKLRPDLRRYQKAIEYFSALDIEEDVATLPEELSDVSPDDVYQFFFKNTCRHLSLNELYGFSVGEDADSATGKVAKFCRDDVKMFHEIVALALTSRDDENKKGISICIEQDAKPVCGIQLYKEDVVPNEYHLYKVGSVSGIRESGDTRVDIFGNNFDWVSLSGISVLFPMDACDVYLSMKFTGEMYGGNPNDQETVFLDRVVVVRRQVGNE